MASLHTASEAMSGTWCREWWDTRPSDKSGNVIFTTEYFSTHSYFLLGLNGTLAVWLPRSPTWPASAPSRPSWSTRTLTTTATPGRRTQNWPGVEHRYTFYYVTFPLTWSRYTFYSTWREFCFVDYMYYYYIYSFCCNTPVNFWYSSI